MRAYLGEGGGGEIKLCISSIAFIAKNMAPVVPPAPTNAVTMAPISPNLMGFTTVRTSPTTAPVFDGSAGNVCVAKSGDREAVPTMASCSDGIEWRRPSEQHAL